MKSVLPLLSLALVFASCTSAYRSGQTPDDVYFSPERPVREYVSQEEKEETREERQQEAEDRYTRQLVRNRNRWSVLDDYYRDPYAYSYNGCNCNCNFNPRLYWSSYYSPYAPRVVISAKAPIYSRPRVYNLQVFNDAQPAKTPVSVGAKTNTTPSRSRTRETGNTLRSLFETTPTYTPATSTQSTHSAPSRSASTSGSSSSSSGSSNNGNAPVRKF